MMGMIVLLVILEYVLLSLESYDLIHDIGFRAIHIYSFFPLNVSLFAGENSVEMVFLLLNIDVTAL